MLSHYIGMKNKPGISHDECCSGGSYGLQMAVAMVASGLHDVVLNCGVGIASSVVPMGKPRVPKLYEESVALHAAADYTNEANYNNSGDGLFDPFDQAGVCYARKNGLSRENMHEVLNRLIVNARNNALKNPVGIMATESIEDEAKRAGFSSVDAYLNDPAMNPRLASIFRARDLNKLVDGAAAMIVCPTDMAKKICKHPIEVAGFGAVNCWPNDMHAADGSGIPFAPNVQAAQAAYAMAGITDPAKELDMLTLHDCNLLNYLRFSEDVGYFAPGEAYKAILAGDIAIDGKKPINTSGGRNGLGHPCSPTNIFDMMEVVYQMRGEAGERQLARAPKVAGVQSYAGGHSFAMTILKSL